MNQKSLDYLEANRERHYLFIKTGSLKNFDHGTACDIMRSEFDADYRFDPKEIEDVFRLLLDLYVRYDAWLSTQKVEA